MKKIKVKDIIPLMEGVSVKITVFICVNNCSFDEKNKVCNYDDEECPYYVPNKEFFDQCIYYDDRTYDEDVLFSGKAEDIPYKYADEEVEFIFPVSKTKRDVVINVRIKEDK